MTEFKHTVEALGIQIHGDTKWLKKILEDAQQRSRESMEDFFNGVPDRHAPEEGDECPCCGREYEE